MVVKIGGCSVVHVGCTRGCLTPMVCSRMDPALKSLSHTEVNFDRQECVTAMEYTVRESDAKHTVMKKTLVRGVFVTYVHPSSAKSAVVPTVL